MQGVNFKINMKQNSTNSDLKFWTGLVSFLGSFIPSILACKLLEMLLCSIKLDFESLKKKRTILMLSGLFVLYVVLKTTIYCIKINFFHENKEKQKYQYTDLEFWSKVSKILLRFIPGFIAGQLLCIGLAFLENDKSFLKDRTHQIFLSVFVFTIFVSICVVLLNRHLNKRIEKRKNTTKETFFAVLHFITLSVPAALAGVLCKMINCDFSFFKQYRQQVVIGVLCILYVAIKLLFYFDSKRYTANKDTIIKMMNDLSDQQFKKSDFNQIITNEKFVNNFVDIYKILCRTINQDEMMISNICNINHKSQIDISLEDFYKLLIIFSKYNDFKINTQDNLDLLNLIRSRIGCKNDIEKTDIVEISISGLLENIFNILKNEMTINTNINYTNAKRLLIGDNEQFI